MSLKKLHHACACLPLGSFSDHCIVWFKRGWEAVGDVFQGGNYSSILFVKFKCGKKNKTKNQRKLTGGLKSQVADLSAGPLRPSAFYPGITRHSSC